MCSLKVYYQDAYLQPEQRENFKTLCSQSDFDVVCVTASWLEESVFNDAVVDVREFDIFRLDYGYNKEWDYTIWGSFIAVRRRLSARVCREWMVEGVECVWVTVPSRGRRGRLHVACVDFSLSFNTDSFNESLAAFRRSHANDTLLVVGDFPKFKGDWISDEQQPIEDDVITKLRSSTSRAGLRQFNNIKCEDECLHNLVFSSVPVNVARCPRPLAPEENSWSRALNIGPAECCQTANDAAGGRRETRPRDVGALVDGLVQSKWEDVTRSLSELIERGRERSDRMARENSERFAKMEERLRTLEERAPAHRETAFGSGGTWTTNDGTGLFGGTTQPNTGLFKQKTASTQSTGTFGATAGEEMDASATGKIAGATLTTTSSHTTRSQHPNTMESQNDDKFFKNITMEVTLMSTSSSISKDNNTTPTRTESRISDITLIEPSISRSASNLKATQDSYSSSSPTTATKSSSRPTVAPEATPDNEVRDILASTGLPVQAPSACSSSTKLAEILSPLGSVQLDSEKNGIAQIEISTESDIIKATQGDTTEQKQQNSMTSSECAASCSNQTCDSDMIETFGTSEGDATANVTTRGSVCEAEICCVTNEAQRSRNRAGEPREDRKSFGESEAIKLANVMTFLSELVGENFNSVNQEKLSAVHDFVQKFKPNIDSTAIGRSFGVATSDITRNSGTDKENSNASEPRGREERTESNDSTTSLESNTSAMQANWCNIKPTSSESNA